MENYIFIKTKNHKLKAKKLKAPVSDIEAVQALEMHKVEEWTTRKRYRLEDGRLCLTSNIRAHAKYTFAHLPVIKQVRGLVELSQQYVLQ